MLRRCYIGLLGLIVLLSPAALRAQEWEHQDISIITERDIEGQARIYVRVAHDTVYVLRGDRAAILYFTEDGTAVVKSVSPEEVEQRLDPEHISRIEVFRDHPERRPRIEIYRDHPERKRIRIEEEEEGVYEHGEVARLFPREFKAHEPAWMEPTPSEKRELQQLAREIGRLERESMALARRIRRGKVQDVEKAEKELEKLLRKIFDLKQQLLETRITQLQNRLRAREGARKTIIERRKQQLLGEDVLFRW